MNEYETQVADWVYQAIQDSSRYSERSQQSAEFRFGVSDLGWCAEKSRRMLDQQVPEDEDLLAAFLGTAIGDALEKAILRANPDAIIQSEVTVELAGEQRLYRLDGHPDIILPSDRLLLDGKTRNGLTTVERTGPSENQQYQRHCYAKGAWEAGLFGDCALEEVQVGNIWVDRSGETKRVHVQIEPYSEEVVRHAAEWLDGVVYAYLNGEEAEKQPPREMCAKTCGFFRECRGYDTDVEGRLTDPEVLTSVQMLTEARALTAKANLLKKEATANLKGVSGMTATHSVRWVHVNESPIQPGTRSAYDRLDIKELK